MSSLGQMKNILASLRGLPARLDQIQKAIGRIEIEQKRARGGDSLEAHEVKVFSQWGEDGILQFLLSRIEVPNRIFVEFGVENYLESNTRFLLETDNWSGLVIDGSPEHVAFIKAQPFYWRHNLKVDCAFIDAENINELLRRNGVSGDIGLLSVDIDGNDYWVLNAIDVVKPRILVCEYNSLFGSTRKVSVPYDPRFTRQAAHHSNLYYGASIAALAHLAGQKGYSLVGSNSTGSNAFFVRKELVGDLKVLTPEQAYRPAQFRESRDPEGRLTFLGREMARKEVGNLLVVDVETGSQMRLAEL